MTRGRSEGSGDAESAAVQAARDYPTDIEIVSTRVNPVRRASYNEFRMPVAGLIPAPRDVSGPPPVNALSKPLQPALIELLLDQPPF